MGREFCLILIIRGGYNPLFINISLCLTLQKLLIMSPMVNEIPNNHNHNIFRITKLDNVFILLCYHA